MASNADNADMAKKRTKLSEQLKRAIAESGKTRYRIAQESGVSEAALSRFVNGERGLNLASLDALGKVLGLEMVIRTPRGGETAGPSKGR